MGRSRPRPFEPNTAVYNATDTYNTFTRPSVPRVKLRRPRGWVAGRFRFVYPTTKGVVETVGKGWGREASPVDRVWSMGIASGGGAGAIRLSCRHLRRVWGALSIEYYGRTARGVRECRRRTRERWRKNVRPRRRNRKTTARVIGRMTVGRPTGGKPSKRVT